MIHEAAAAAVYTRRVHQAVNGYFKNELNRPFTGLSEFPKISMSFGHFENKLIGTYTYNIFAIFTIQSHQSDPKFVVVILFCELF